MSNLDVYHATLNQAFDPRDSGAREGRLTHAVEALFEAYLLIHTARLLLDSIQRERRK